MSQCNPYVKKSFRSEGLDLTINRSWEIAHIYASWDARRLCSQSRVKTSQQVVWLGKSAES